MNVILNINSNCLSTRLSIVFVVREICSVLSGKFLILGFRLHYAMRSSLGASMSFFSANHGLFVVPLPWLLLLQVSIFSMINL